MKTDQRSARNNSPVESPGCRTANQGVISDMIPRNGGWTPPLEGGRPRILGSRPFRSPRPIRPESSDKAGARPRSHGRSGPTRRIVRFESRVGGREAARVTYPGKCPGAGGAWESPRSAARTCGSRTGPSRLEPAREGLVVRSGPRPSPIRGRPPAERRAIRRPPWPRRKGMPGPRRPPGGPGPRASPGNCREYGYSSRLEAC